MKSSCVHLPIISENFVCKLSDHGDPGQRRDVALPTTLSLSNPTRARSETSSMRVTKLSQGPSRDTPHAYGMRASIFRRRSIYLGPRL